MDLSQLRLEYKNRPLHRSHLHKDPFEQFKIWLNEALAAEEIEPNAMALATANKEGAPSCRHVLLKAVDEKGFIFFTNRNSRKAQQLQQNPQASASFWWRQLERQVCFEGPVEEVSEAIATQYFGKRPRTSRLAAWSSPKQSATISSRDTLEQEYRKMEETFKNREIAMPPFWTGFRIVPLRIEFWQGRESRLHDRFLYLKTDSGWMTERLSP